jgi:hypothetical protein
MKEAAIEAKQGGERGITARSVKKVTAVSTTLDTYLTCFMAGEVVTRSGSSRDLP